MKFNLKMELQELLMTRKLHSMYSTISVRESDKIKLY
jgi:hypothetical protein